MTVIDMAFTIKRKGTSVTYVPGPDGTFAPVRERVLARLTVSYDEDERRLPVPHKVSYHQGFRLLRQETGQAMAVINASAEVAAIYGMEEERALALPGPTVALTYLVDLLLRTDSRQKDGKPLLVAVFLGAVRRSGVPLLVIGVNADRTMAQQDLVPSVADFPTTITNILGAMVAAGTMRGLDFDPRQTSRSEETKRLEREFQAERMLVFGPADLVEIAASAKTYPRERVYRGLPRSTLSRVVLGVSLAVLAASGGFAAAAEWSRRKALDETASIEQSIETRRTLIRSRLLDRVSGLGARLSLDPADLFSAADAIARSSGRTSLAATLDSSRITLSVPQVGDRLPSILDRRSASAARDVDLVMSELKMPAPTGWVQQSIETTGDLNGWLVSFTSVPVERDLLDLVGGGRASGPSLVGTVQASGGKPAGSAGTGADARR